MAIFRYKAVTASGDPIEGEMEARTRDEVILKLQDAGNIPLDAREATSGGGAGQAPLQRGSRGGACARGSQGCAWQ